jgi:predicted nucleotidyltransferase
MNDRLDHRQGLLDGLGRFLAASRRVAGVQRIALLGSIVTAKRNPKDIDVLVVVSDDADLAGLAMYARRLQGHAQSFNRGADVFLADERCTYIGRTCRWKDCRPGVRQSCDAQHCGRRAYLHDDLDAMTLSSTVIAAPPVTLWPVVERRGRLPPDVEVFIAALEHTVQHAHAPGGACWILRRRW